MRSRAFAFLAGAFLIVPAVAGAIPYSAKDHPRATETLVEGHTVFAVVQSTICYDEPSQESRKCPGDPTAFDVAYDIRVNISVQRLGTAVAVLVRDRIKEVTPPPSSPTCGTNRDLVATLFYENPGVLWFNDQFLVGDDLDIVEIDVDANVDVCTKETQIRFAPVANWRYPCGGWVYATQAGNPDPRTFGAWAYEESYRFADPNDKVWIVDKYSPVPLGLTLPPVDVMAEVDPYTAPATPVIPVPAEPPGDTYGPNVYDDDPYSYDNDDAYDGDVRVVVAPHPTNGAVIQYYLGFFNLWTVPILYGSTAGTADGGPGTASCDPYEDEATAGSSPGVAFAGDAGPVTAASHPAVQAVEYNAVLFFYFEDLVPRGVKVHGKNGLDDGDVSYCEEGTEWDCPGLRDDDDEGNSHAYNSAHTTTGPIHLHPTAAVDLYYHNVAPPLTGPKRYAVYETRGSNAPSNSFDPNAIVDDRVRVDPCGDGDARWTDWDTTYNGGSTYSTTSYNEAGGTAHAGEGEEYYGTGGSTRYAPVPTSGNGGASTSECTGEYDGGVTGRPGESY